MSEERKPTRLPAPPTLALVKMNEMEVAEMIEKHINFVDDGGRSVHLPMPFVRHFKKRDDTLPRVYGFSQMPIVLPDGTLLTGGGLNRKYGIIFRVPRELDALMPIEHGDAEVKEAMRFLVDEWLVDVATEYEGKCVVIALCLSIIERMLLPERPCFFITAGKRGSGKTTTMHMVSQAVLGQSAMAAAWSPSAEERRKALFAYLETGLPMLPWDNLPRGAAVSCPSIEKSLTTEIYSDRVLGESTTRRVPAYTIQVFTGNNISPRGDLASRALSARMGSDRPDPENREFAHSDPIAWTLKHRGSLLQAMYNILLGNPRRWTRDKEPPKTRFKEWWDIVGSAIEHAAALHKADQPISFERLFLSGEAMDEETVGSAEVLGMLLVQWPDGFKASEVAGEIRRRDTPANPDAADDAKAAAEADRKWSRALKAGMEQATGQLMRDVSATIVNWRLKALADAPINVGGAVLVMRFKASHQGGSFRVEAIPAAVKQPPC